MTELAVQLGRWAAGLGLADVPAAVRREATRSILDVVGVALAGSATAAAGRVRRHISEAHGAGPCHLLGATAASSPLGAALANGIAAHVLDFDDTCYAGIVHGSAVVFPAVLAAGEASGAGGADLLAAFIAGCEVEYAIGRALAGGVYRWWTTAVLGAIGAAAGAARALRLDESATAHAIALAACQASGLRGVFGTAAKAYLCGRAAQAGVDAAFAAQAGMTAPLGIFTGSDGFFSRFGEGVPNHDPAAELGRRYALLDPGIAIKLFPVCSAAQAATEATLGLIADHRLAAGAIERVRCAVTPFVASCLRYPCPESVEQAQFSLPFAIGCVLAYGKLGVGCLAPERCQDPLLLEAMAKVEMNEDPALADEAAHLEAASVTLMLRDGRALRRHVPAATGTPQRPASDDQLRDKFYACAGPVAGAAEAEALWRRIGGIETAGSAAALLA